MKFFGKVHPLMYILCYEFMWVIWVISGMQLEIHGLSYYNSISVKIAHCLCLLQLSCLFGTLEYLSFVERNMWSGRMNSLTFSRCNSLIWMQTNKSWAKCSMGPSITLNFQWLNRADPLPPRFITFITFWPSFPLPPSMFGDVNFY